MQRPPDNPAGTKIAKRAAKVLGVDPATLYFHGGELTRAARHRQHRRVTFASVRREKEVLATFTRVVEGPREGS